MDLSLESALAAAAGTTDQPGSIAGRPMAEWNAAYTRVESYFRALRVKNRMLTGRLVMHVLGRAVRRAPSEPDRTATELAAEEMDHVVTEWFGQVLAGTPHRRGSDAVHARPAGAAAGRHAGQMAGAVSASRPVAGGVCARHAGRLPACRTGFPAGPAWTPRPLDLGAIETITQMSRLPYFKMVAVWLAFALPAGASCS